MPDKYFKKIKKFSTYFITTLIIFSFVWAPFDYVFTARNIAHAQVSGGYNTANTFSSNNGPGISGYIKGLGPQIYQLPQCKDIINSGIKTLFKGVKGVFKKEAKSVSSTRSKNFIEDDAVRITSEILNENTEKTTTNTGETNTNTAKLTENQLCVKSIGKLVGKMLIQKITLSTITWIQSGYEGKPFFVQDPGKFFGDIAKYEILQFGAELSGNPYGKAYLQGLVNAYNTKFQENARYSLNELIAQTNPSCVNSEGKAMECDIIFSRDFSKGGWGAWEALTSVPANNPLGFQLLASNEIAQRLSGTDKSTAEKKQDTLNQSGGFLGQEVCVEPEGLTHAQHNAALEEGKLIYKGTQTYIEGTCRGGWQYVTPGKMIADRAQKISGFQEDSLNNIEDLNDAVAAILDAVLAQFSSKLQEGFVGITNEGSDGTFIMTSYNANGNYLISQTEKDFTPYQLNSNWLYENSEFNIRTDITQALIDEQRIYKEKITEQNIVLEDLNTTIFQLDYCIPGAHPGYEQDSRRVLTAVKNQIVSKTITDMKNVSRDQIKSLAKGIAAAAGFVIGAMVGATIGAKIGATIGTAILPGIGTAIGAAIGVAIGAITGWIIDQLDDLDDIQKLDLYYSTIFGGFTGIHLNTNLGKGGGKQDAKIRNKHEITRALDTILDRYIDVHNKYFTPGFLPPVAKDNEVEFEKIPRNIEVANYNEEKIISLNSVITRLSILKDTIDALNDKLESDLNLATTITQTQAAQDEYDKALTPIIAEFSRLSEDMVSGNGIASVDAELKRAKDDIKYVYDQLLTGPFGCEQDLYENPRLLEAKPNVEDTLKIRSVWRATYPFKLWYDYNNFGPNDDLPTPQQIPGRLAEYTDKTTSNKMPAYVQNVGPGFLTNVYFNYTPNSDKNPDGSLKHPDLCGTPFPFTWQLDCIRVDDLFHWVDAWNVTVGINPGPNSENGQRDSSFEQIIGIY